MSAFIGSDPNSPFFRPLPGFPVGSPYPMVGMDLQTGKRDQDLLAGIGSALPALSPRAKEYYDFYTATAPQRLLEQEQQARLSSRLTREQLSSLYPYLSAAGAESTARNLAASQAFAAFKEQLPTSVQNIMASKQAQLASAAGAEAQRQFATAAQQQAAKQFAGTFAGKYVSAA
jgi:hypothetical protein